MNTKKKQSTMKSLKETRNAKVHIDRENCTNQTRALTESLVGLTTHLCLRLKDSIYVELDWK